jgi:hypothetical protein
MYILPSVLPSHSAKLLFAEYLRLGTRQRLTPLIAVTSWRSFAECLPLLSARHYGKKFFAEYFSLPSVWHSAKEKFTVCFPLPSAELGKEALCRVLDSLHSAKPWILGKDRVSGSDCRPAVVQSCRSNESELLPTTSRQLDVTAASPSLGRPHDEQTEDAVN